MELGKIFNAVKIIVVLELVFVLLGNFIALYPQLDLLAEITMAIPAYAIPMYAGFFIVKNAGMTKKDAGIAAIIVRMTGAALNVSIFLFFVPEMDPFMFSVFAGALGIGLLLSVILSYFLGYIAGQYAEKVTNKLKPSKGIQQNEGNKG